MSRSAAIFNSLIGIPWADKGRSESGCDCWGLHVLAQGRRGVTVPSYDSCYVTPEERAEIDAVITGQKTNPLWTAVMVPDEFDLVLFRIGRFESHVGTWVAPRLMLHMPPKGCSRIESYTDGQWAPRLIGFWRFTGILAKELAA